MTESKEKFGSQQNISGASQQNGAAAFSWTTEENGSGELIWHYSSRKKPWDSKLTW